MPQQFIGTIKYIDTLNCASGTLKCIETKKCVNFSVSKLDNPKLILDFIKGNIIQERDNNKEQEKYKDKPELNLFYFSYDSEEKKSVASIKKIYPEELWKLLQHEEKGEEIFLSLRASDFITYWSSIFFEKIDSKKFKREEAVTSFKATIEKLIKNKAYTEFSLFIDDVINKVINNDNQTRKNYRHQYKYLNEYLYENLKNNFYQEHLSKESYDYLLCEYFKKELNNFKNYSFLETGFLEKAGEKDIIIKFDTIFQKIDQEYTQKNTIKFIDIVIEEIVLHSSLPELYKNISIIREHLIKNINDLYKYNKYFSRKSYLKLLIEAFKSIVKQIECDNQQQNIIFKTQLKNIYDTLDAKDKELAKSWTLIDNKEETDYKINQMISARSAEKIVMKAYKSWGAKVEDIAIKQLDNSNPNWKLYDLEIEKDDRYFLVDVKNARSSLNQKSRYSEFRIPHFKTKRFFNNHNNQDKEIIIAGVLSDYIPEDRLRNKNISDDAYGHFLGCTSQSRIRLLQDIFCDGNPLSELSFPRKTQDDFLPIWLFEYPEIAFSENRIEYANNKLKELGQDFIDFYLASHEKQDVQTPKEILYSYIMLCIESLSEISDDTYLKLRKLGVITRYEERFFRRLNTSAIKFNRLSLPVVFLSILSDFLVNPVDLPDPNFYMDFFRQSYGSKISQFGSILDPLNTLDELESSISMLWEYKEENNLAEYTVFKFENGGILRGIKKNENKPKTILAYCGGKIIIENNKKITSKDFKGVTCGYEPLISTTKNSHCDKCGRLICSECSTCLIGCERMNSL